MCLIDQILRIYTMETRRQGGEDRKLISPRGRVGLGGVGKLSRSYIAAGQIS
jgi:hypothetical protein